MGERSRDVMGEKLQHHPIGTTMVETFNPAQFLEVTSSSLEPTGLIILNQKIHSQDLFSQVWSKTKYHICADGGANRLYDLFEQDSETRGKMLPDIITGDFDSLRPAVREYYEKLGVKLIQDRDLYSTDFMKSVRALKSLGSSKTIVAFGGMGGRVDQGFHSIHQLYTTREQGQLLYLISDESISFLIPAETQCHIKTPLKYLGETCGIIPLEGSTRITTHGLRWDITDWETSFATQMSTSNHLIHEEIDLYATKTVLFTAELRGYADRL